MKTLKNLWTNGGRMVATWGLVGVGLGVVVTCPALTVVCVVAAWVL